MSLEPTRARDDLRAWQEYAPRNYYETDRQLRRILVHWLPEERMREESFHLVRFGEVAATTLEQAAVVNNQLENLPRLQRYTAIGERTEGVEHHPSYHACGRAIYQEGRVIAAYEEPPANLLAQALFYLSSHAGEAGHNCPVACTAGVVKALRAVGSEALQRRWLPGLLEADYERRLHGAQFLTELQGGSDVGANAVRAELAGEEYGAERARIRGEKWFCSNVDADVFLITARVAGGPDGTRGLGLFLVPRRLDDGSVNGFAVRRLKDKLGTRSMASAEIDLEGAVGYAVGPLERGFATTMDHVIDTSRLYNSVGCAGIARRAFLVADAYARHRRAFGPAIVEYPLIHEMLAHLRATSAALTAGALRLAWYADRAEGEARSEAEQAFVRVATNLVKMRSCQHSHRAVLTGIEALGGNGAIETFSVLPRLLRDNVVYENWEGTHNTLIAQTLRDFARRGLHEGFLRVLDHELEAVDQDLAVALQPAHAAVHAARSSIAAALDAAETDAGRAALFLRPALEQLADAVLVAALAADVEGEPDEPRRSQETELVAWFAAHALGPPPRRDTAYADRAAAIVELDAR